MAIGGTKKQHAALVYNPVKVNEQRLLSAVRGLSKKYGWASPKFYQTSIEDPGQGRTRQAIAAGAAAVLVAGGDGTVRAVSEAMAGTEVPLTIVPSGTGNLFARNLGLPLAHPETMIEATFIGMTHPVDIGWARLTRENGEESEHAFVVLAGMGLDAKMIAHTNAQLKKQVGWIAYIDGAARSLPGSRPFRTVFQIDDDKLRTTKVHSMLFANCGALPAGITLVPDASLTDGLLDVVVIRPTGPLGWLALWRRVWWDNSVLRRSRTGRWVLKRRGRDATIRYLSGRTSDAAMDHPTSIELDGDEFGEAVRMSCRLDQGGLTIVLPKGHDLSQF